MGHCLFFRSSIYAYTQVSQLVLITTGGGVLFSSQCPLQHRELIILPYFGFFLSRNYALFAYFLQVQIMRWCNKIGKYQICFQLPSQMKMMMPIQKIQVGSMLYDTNARQQCTKYGLKQKVQGQGNANELKGVCHDLLLSIFFTYTIYVCVTLCVYYGLLMYCVLVY